MCLTPGHSIPNLYEYRIIQLNIATVFIFVICVIVTTLYYVCPFPTF